MNKKERAMLDRKRHQANKTKANNRCPNCGKLIQPSSMMCPSCARLGKRNPFFGHGKCGDKNPHWKGGRAYDSYGYILVSSTISPAVNTQGYIREHRMIMEKYLGRILLETEVVHHINGIKDDNRLENLMKFASQAEHAAWHKRPQGE